MADNVLPTPALQEVTASENVTVGASEVNEASVQVNTDPVPTQVSPPRAPEPKTTPVHEVFVETDRKILDPSDPLAVQIPDAGRGDPSLPIHGLAAVSPEAAFAAEAKKK